MNTRTRASRKSAYHQEGDFLVAASTHSVKHFPQMDLLADSPTTL